MKTSKTATHADELRLRLLQSGVIFVAVLIIINLFSQSVISHASATQAAKNQQITRQDVLPKRGTIYAVNEDSLSVVATTGEQFTISVVPKNIKDKKKTASILAGILKIDEVELFAKINNDKPYLPPIAKRIDKETKDRIVKENIQGVVIESEHVRYYPEGSLAAQLLGFVNLENKGNYGIEGYYDEELKGLSGTVVAEKDNKGRFISILSNQSKVKDGDSLVLTIDQNVQFVAEQKLQESLEKYNASGGQISIIDVKTGGIIAHASLPEYDPNKYNEVKSEDQHLFSDPIIGSIYEPGSIMKPIIVAIGIDADKIKADEEGVYASSVKVQGYDIHTSTKEAYGRETVTQVLENSDNVAMVSYAEKIGTDLMFDYLQKFGFGTKLGIDTSGETTGKLLEKKRWRDINRATISFGQGVSVTPLQMLMSYQVLGNDGKLVLPHVVSKIRKPDGKEVVIEPKQMRQVIKPETAQVVREMLVSVVERGHGKKAAVPGYKIGGKTGTAQIPNKDSGGYEEGAHIGSFAGLVPADKPRFAMLVKLDRPTAVEYAEASAAPTFGEVAKFLIQYYQIPKE